MMLGCAAILGGVMWLVLWLTDRDVQWVAAAVIACWPALLWIYRERGPQTESAPQR